MLGNKDVAGVEPSARPLSLDFAGVPIKKRRFFRCPSPPPEEESSEPVQKDDPQKGQSSSQSEKLGDYSAGKAANTLLASDATGSFVPREMEGRCADTDGPGVFNTVKVEPSAVGCSALSAMEKEAKPMVSEKSLGVASSTLLVPEGTCSFVLKKIQETCSSPNGPSGYNCVKVESSADRPAVLSAIPDKEAKLVVSEKSVGVASSVVNDGLNSRLCEFLKERSDEQRDKGSVLTMSKTLGNPDLSLGLEEKRISSPEDGKSYKHSGVCGNIETVSLNLSLGNEEICDRGTDIVADRSNWDLNTTMDAWEESVKDAAIHSKPISESHDVKPLLFSAGIQETCFNYISNQLLCESDCRSRTGDTVSQTEEMPMPEASLNLQPSPAMFSLNIDQEPSSSYINKQLPVSISNISSPSFLAHSNASKVGSGIVKHEPIDEAGLDSGGASSRALHSLKSTTVKAELIGKPGPDVLRLLHCSPTVNLVAPGSIKPEVFHEPSLRISETAKASSIQCDKSVLDSSGQSTCSANELKRPDISTLNGCQPMDKQVLECREMTGTSVCSPPLSVTGNIPEDFRDNHTSGSPHSMELAKTIGEGGETVSSPKQVLECREMTGTSACSAVLSVTGDIPEDFRDNRTPGSPHRMELAKTDGEGGDTVSSPKNSPCVQVGHESVVHVMTEIATAEKKNTNSINKSKVNSVDKLAPANHQVHPAGDEENICSSHGLVEEERSEPEYESDGNSVPMDIEEDGQRCDSIEDDVLPEPGKDVAVGITSEVNKNDIVNGACHDAGTSGELQGQHIRTGLHPKAMENPSGDPASVSDIVKSTFHEEERTKESCGDVSLEEPFAVQMPPGGADEGASFMTSQQEIPIMSGEALNDLGTAQLSNQAHSEGQESSITIVQDLDENAKLNNGDQNHLQLPKGEESLGDDSTKDPSTGVHRSRIINLSRASTETTPSKTSPIGSYTERLPDGPLGGDRAHPRERNDLCYNEGYDRFSRERHQDRRNYQLNYARGRRLYDGNNSLRAARTSESNFVPELRDCLSEYGVPKNKYVAAAAAAAAVAAAGTDTKYVNHNVTDDLFVGAGRGRRKVEDDEAENFHRLSSRRRSPGGRDAASGIQMARRVSRNINEDDGEGVGLRRSAKFMRGIHADVGERPYSRNQRPYEGVDSHFGQGARKFLSVQKRALPRFHSKSPIRSRSPGSWPASKKRSPDAFDGPSDLPHRVSPRIYRMDRTRSPDHAGFPSEVVTRRHGSPTFFSRANELREFDSSHEHAHSRSMISRSPTSHVALRNNRRFGAGNPRDRTDGDQFVNRPMHSGRFHEVSDEDSEAVRRFGERRGPVRSFRATFNGPDDDNYPVSTEDRSLRFFRNDDQQFQGRVNLRERPFQRGMKNRSVNAPRRQIGVEDEEGNCTGQGMYDDDQDEMSRLKRKRF